MCGIAGYIETRPDAVIKEQLRLLEHRGPDALAWLSPGPVTIGQTRLAVIDLDTGDPPITSEDGSVGVAFNGEIYNFRALRDELKDRGHVFSTTGDTEVIAHLAEDLSPVDTARRLDGMYAYAVHDGSRGTLTLARDRLGKKPLYYYDDGRTFVFASEIKALLAHPDVPRRLDPDALAALVTFGYVPTPFTSYEGIRSLPPGCVLTIHDDGRRDVRRYWELPLTTASDGSDMSFQEAARTVRGLLRDAVGRRLISDVPLGAFLSGGVDSSAVVALMSESSERPIKTFTIGFEDSEGFDERRSARLVAERFGTDHTEFVVKPQAVDVIEKLVWHYDQPFGDSSAIPMYLLSELTRRHVTVALSGDGGDELFAGYERFAAALAVEPYLRIPAPLRGAGRRLLMRLSRRAFKGRVGSLQRFVEGAEQGLPDGYLSWVGLATADRCRSLVPTQSPWALQDYERIWQKTHGAGLLYRLLYLNLSTYLLDDLLVKIDRTSMGHALEVRCPFLDKDLLDFALRLPREAHIKGFSRKRVLKEAVKDLLPKDILNRRKRGFGVPLDRWFREDLGSYVEARLGSATARVREHLNGREVDRILAEHRTGARDRGQLLWTLLTLEVFLRKEGW